jgi:hypothetical protein
MPLIATATFRAEIRLIPEERTLGIAIASWDGEEKAANANREDHSTWPDGDRNVGWTPVGLHRL